MQAKYLKKMKFNFNYSDTLIVPPTTKSAELVDKYKRRVMNPKTAQQSQANGRQPFGSSIVRKLFFRFAAMTG
jgi:hypothetical protein